MSRSRILVVGGGLAGLSCALQLRSRGLDCRVLEAAGELGGRAQTDAFEGFQLDRGFQVLLTAYADAQRLLDYDALRLGRFEPGALVRCGGRFHRFSDPWRRPSHALSTAFSPAATLGDKLRVAKLRGDVQREGFQPADQSTLEFLRKRGFSPLIIERFFRPFFGGVFLDPSLATSATAFAFLFRMFSTGAAALPAAGMGAIASQLANGLPTDAVETGVVVNSVSSDGVETDSGHLEADAVVVATDASTADGLLGAGRPRTWQGTTCLYFAADRAPTEEPILMLNGEGQGPINSVCVPSVVAAGYAPTGQHLVSASVVGASDEDEESLQAAVTAQLEEWFGPDARSWRHLRTYRISAALPSQRPGDSSTDLVAQSGVVRCGDYFGSASIQGALASGRRAADHVADSLAAGPRVG